MLSQGNHLKSNNKQYGVTLIELMISMVIGLMMIGLISQLIIEVRRTAELQSDVFHVMQKSAHLSALFKAQIKRAGYVGCSRITAENSLLPAGKYAINVNNRLVGSDHELTIRYMDYKTEALLRDMANRSVLLLSTSVNIHPNEVWAISNCKRSEWFEVDKVQRNHGVLIVNLKQPLSTLYDVTSEVGKLKINRLYSKSIKNHSTLFMQDINGWNSKLIDDVNDLNFKYSINESGRYVDVSASQIRTWSQVRGVAISATLQSGKVKQSWQSYYVMR